MPPEYLRSLREAEAAGALTIMEQTEISAVRWAAEPGVLQVALDAPGPPLPCDVLLLASGADIDLSQYGVLQDMMALRPIATAAGLPAIEPSLAWAPGEEFYLMGALASLRLGPDALNLAGARHGACRLARVLRPALTA